LEFAVLITELQVVNACLASMGEAPANSLDEDNTFITAARDALSNKLPEEQSAGWYYNTEISSIHPNTDGEYYAPADTLGLSTNANPPWLSLRGRRLYDNRNARFLNGSEPVKVVIIRLLPLEDCPFHAARAIKAATVIYFQQSYDGDEFKLRQAYEQYADARRELMAEHTRAVRANMLYQGDTGVTLQQNRFHTGIDSRWN
jgi:hypothetical protein